MNLPLEEPARLAALRRYGILDTPAEIPYDDATLLATQVTGTPCALLTFVDEHREWFKSRIGIEPSELPRHASFCGQAILRPNAVLTVDDALLDARFNDNLLVHGATAIRFYAGAPLISGDGAAVGTICVMDRVPRILTDLQIAALQAISRQVVTQLEMRRLIVDLKVSGEALQRSHRALEQDKHQLTTVNAELHKHSLTDALTGLCNRRAFEQHLAAAIGRARSRCEALSLVMIDVDRFKRFNDEFGHAAGDSVLKQVATALQSSARKNDFVARYGGEEFVVLSPGVEEDQAGGLAERLCRAVRSTQWRDMMITVSAGVATWTDTAHGAASLVAYADQALYHAKSSGRDRVIRHSHLASAMRRLASAS